MPMLCFVAVVPLAFHLSVAAPRASGQRASVQLASWAAVDAGTREDTVAALTELKEDGSSKLWNTMRLASRPVTLRELCQTTKLDEKVLDPTATEYDIGDIQDASVKVLIGSTLASGLWAVGTDLLGLDAGLRFTGTYLIAGIPIGLLAIGSTAPGLLFLPIEAYKSAMASEEEKRTKAERVCRHEASHLLCAHVLGVPVQEVSTEAASGPRVVVYDEELAQQPGQLVSAEQIDRLAVVAVSGLMAEADTFGKALGVAEDLKLLNSILLRCSPPIPAQKQQDTTRYAALMAWTILKKHPFAYDAIAKALDEGKPLSECLRAAEEAEASRSEVEVAAAAAVAETMAKETPQQKAARERAEDAARGRF